MEMKNVKSSRRSHSSLVNSSQVRSGQVKSGQGKLIPHPPTKRHAAMQCDAMHGFSDTIKTKQRKCNARPELHLTLRSKAQLFRPQANNGGHQTQQQP